MNNPLSLLANSYIGWKKPIYLVHLISFRCNARCKHCFIDFEDPKTFEREMTLPQIIKMTKTLGSSMANVNLSGGEPFLRPDIFEIAKAYFENAKVQSLYITTNGMFTGQIKEFLDRFIESKIKGKIIISISIDNFARKHNEGRRVKGLFANAVETYKLVKNYNNQNILANIALTVTPYNASEIIEVYRYLKKCLKANSFTATLMREEGIIKKIPEKEKSRMFLAYAKLTRLISRDLNTTNENGFGKSLQGKIMNSKNLITYKVMKKYAKKSEYLSHCPAAALFGVIYPNGDVYPCEIIPELKIGNVRNYKYNFLKLWQSKRANTAKKFIAENHCHCSYECAWSVNIVSNPKYIPSLLAGVIKSYL